jgi:cbb3-type cytochrome oxidase subunit 3
LLAAFFWFIIFLTHIFLSVCAHCYSIYSMPMGIKVL